MILCTSFPQQETSTPKSQGSKSLSKVNAVGDVDIKTWHWDYTGAFSFTFDDAFKSQVYHAAPILESFGFRGSFYLNTASVGDPLPDWSVCGNWAGFNQLALNGHEIGSHTVTHPNLPSLSNSQIINELNNSKIKIEQKIPSQKCITFAYPYEGTNKTVMALVKQYYQAGRGEGNDWPVQSSLSEDVNDYRDDAPDYIDNWYNYPSIAIIFTNPGNHPPPRTMSTDFDKLYIDFDNYVQNTIDQEMWGLLQTHDVVPFDSVDESEDSGTWEPMSTEWFTAACQMVYNAQQNGDLWVAPVRDVMKYMKERDDAVSFQSVSSSSTVLTINVSNAYDPTIFNFPLTADITIRSDWGAVIFNQGGVQYQVDAYTNSNGNHVVQVSIDPNGGQITLTKTNPLPVELASFTAAFTGKEVKLAWNTATEVNNYGFNIERKINNDNWEKIAFVNGYGNSNSPKNYAYVDQTPIGGNKILYRLKQIDNDGQYEFSNALEVNVVPSEFTLFQNFPNPFNSTTIIRYQIASESEVSIKIYNILGAEVLSLVNERKEAGIYETEFKSDNLPSGTYIYRIITDGFTDTKKMTLLK